jgi:hypothetical protein
MEQAGARVDVWCPGLIHYDSRVLLLYQYVLLYGTRFEWAGRACGQERFFGRGDDLGMTMGKAGSHSSGQGGLRMTHVKAKQGGVKAPLLRWLGRA